jgi:hypothetical protein
VAAGRATPRTLHDIVPKRGPMTVLTKAQALQVLRRAYGPDRAESLAGRLPDRIDLDSDADTRLLAELGVTRGGLFDALGAEL